MSQIRRKSLKATFWVYIGFTIGALNTYLLTNREWFTTEENGLVRAILEIGIMIFAFSSLGSTNFLFKFFPYYHDNLDKRKNDILALAITVSMAGFIIACSGIYLFHDLIVRKFSANSILLVQFFYCVLPVGFFVLLFSLLESYSYGFKMGVTTTFLKETLIRVYTLIVISLKVLDLISFRAFIILFSFQFALITIALVWLLAREKKLWLSFRPSRVTKKFRKKIISIMGLTSIVLIVTALRQSIDGLVLAAKLNLSNVAIFGLSVYFSSLLQAPFRSIIAVTIPILSRAWKDKDIQEIDRIYKRSSINLLSFALFLFFLIWLNYSNAIDIFNINPEYLKGQWVFFILGIITIIEMGTGISGQIIGTSVHWRFELWTSVLLTCLIIPLSYFLTVEYGILGPALANLLSFTVYNSIRYFFLLRKFNMQPFTSKTIEVITIALLSYFIAYAVSHSFKGIWYALCTSCTYCLVFGILFFRRNISPDAKPVLNTLLVRLKLKDQSTPE